MQILVLAGLIVAMIALWRQLGALRGRIELLEMVGAQTAWSEPAPRREAPSPRSVATITRQAPPVDRRPEPAMSPPSDPPVEPEVAAAPAKPTFVRPGFEEMFGRRLPIWAGGVTLAVAGALIVRFSIDAGLFPPVVRVLGGLLFGCGLLGAAEYAHRQTGRVRDPRVAQALGGAGIASLYASILIASNLYHLVGPLVGFLGLAGVTAAASGLAVRLGAPSALLGLVGGLAAPALVGGGPANIPLLATYLALVVGGLCALSRRQRWAWLGMSALVGGFGWGGVLILGGALNGVATASIGTYLLLLGLAFPFLGMGGLHDRVIRTVSCLLAALEMAALVATGGFAMLNWGLFGLLSVAIIWLARRDARLADVPAVGLAVVLALLAAWPHPTVAHFAVVMIPVALIYGGPTFRVLWRRDTARSAAAQIAAIGFAGLVLPLLHFHRVDDGMGLLFGGLALVCAALPGGAALLGWRTDTRHTDTRFPLLATSAAFLVAAAGILALPLWSVPMSVAAVGLGLLLTGRASHDLRLEPGAWTLAGLSVLLLGLDYRVLDEMVRACGGFSDFSDPFPLAVSVARWSGLSAMLAACAWRGRQPVAKAAAQVLVVLTGYVAMTQFVPVSLLPLLPALGLIGVAVCDRALVDARLLPAAMTCVGLSLLWATEPLALWAAPAIRSLAGAPILSPSLPVLPDVLLKLLLPAMAIAAALCLSRFARGAWIAATGLASLLGGVALHILYTHAFCLASSADFIRSGVAERTIWEALLLGMAILLWQVGRRRQHLAPVAIGFGTASFAHALCYSFLLHDPLWTQQAVGVWPLLNWLLPSYALPLFAIWLAGRAMPDLAARHDRARSIVQVVLILLFAASQLRQAFHGSLLTVPGVTASEDVLRSIGAIVIAIGFLLWGIRRASQEWRIGSLVLMLAAVGKVFLIDAAGLDGLTRIASFAALGFSLIGIGWLYSRYLKAGPLLTAHE